MPNPTLSTEAGRVDWTFVYRPPGEEDIQVLDDIWGIPLYNDWYPEGMSTLSQDDSPRYLGSRGMVSGGSGTLGYIPLVYSQRVLILGAT